MEDKQAADLDNYAAAADHFARFAILVNLAQSCPLTKLLVVFDLIV